MTKKQSKKVKKVGVVHEHKTYVLFDTLKEAIDAAKKMGISDDSLEIVTIALPPKKGKR